MPVPTDVEQEDGTTKKKNVYEENDKKEFMELVFGQWNYFADTKSMTKATFSMDIPTKAIKILSYKNDIVLDPFAGSGTSLVAAEILGRRWVGIELSPNYAKIAKEYKRTLYESGIPVITFSADDIYKTTEELKEKGVKFKKTR